MNEDNKDPESGKVDAGEKVADAIEAPAGKKAQRKSRHGEPLAWVVLFLLLAAIGGSVFLWQQFQTRARTAQEQMDTLNRGIQSLASELQSVRAQSADRAQLESVARQSEKSADALANRLSTLETQFGELRSLGSRDRRAWLGAETAHLLRLADDEARIAKDPAAAAAALEAADQRLKSMADPRMTPVRGQIANVLAELHAVAVPDTTGMSLVLDALGRQVPALPLAHRTGRDYAANAAPAQAGEAQPSWWQRFKDEAASAFRTMVTIRRDNPDAKPLLAPQAEQYLRFNLQLRLDAARIALLQHDQAAFGANIEAVSAWIKTYFAKDDPAVQAALRDLEKLAQTPVALKLPDVSGPLAAFEQVRAGEAAAR